MVEFAAYLTLALSYSLNFATNSTAKLLFSSPEIEIEIEISLSPPMHRLDRGDVWKNKARSLQLQLRGRFRVAVDRHWRRRNYHTFIPDADGYFSSTLQRWLNRFRDFRRDSLPSSTSFYRKRGSQFNYNSVFPLLFMMYFREIQISWMLGIG